MMEHDERHYMNLPVERDWLSWIALLTSWVSVPFVLWAAFHLERGKESFQLCAGMLSIAGSMWLASGVYLRSEHVESMLKNKTSKGRDEEIVQALSRGSHKVVWGARLLLGGAVSLVLSYFI